MTGRGRLIRACGLLLALLAAHAVETTAVVDMAGRTVQVPAVPRRITCIHSIPSHLVWRLAPTALVSIDVQFKERMLLIPEAETRRLAALPLTGIYRSGIQREDILALRPDLILSLSKDPNLDQEQRDFAAPVFAISKDSLADYAASIRLVGRLVGNAAEGDRLAGYWTATMERVAQAVAASPETVPPRVYYAQRHVSTTVGSATIMASIIRQAGGRSFAETLVGSLQQRESESLAVPLEDVIAWNPDVIIAASAAARDEILADPRWSSVGAVRTRRVHAVLKLAMPDRVQSLLGLLWMYNALHPGAPAFDLLAESRRFYDVFCLNGEVSPERMQDEM